MCKKSRQVTPSSNVGPISPAFNPIQNWAGTLNGMPGNPHPDLVYLKYLASPCCVLLKFPTLFSYFPICFEHSLHLFIELNATKARVKLEKQTRKVQKNIGFVIV